jgi:hypothetical protein
MVVHDGECYPIAEAFYHILGGKDAGWTPKYFWVDDDITHWYLEHESGFILDPTACQFVDINYGAGVGCGFLTKEPSKRARKYMEQLQCS